MATTTSKSKPKSKKPAVQPAEPNTFVRVDFPDRETVVEIRSYNRGVRGGCGTQQKLTSGEWTDLIDEIGTLPESSIRRAFRVQGE